MSIDVIKHFRTDEWGTHLCGLETTTGILVKGPARELRALLAEVLGVSEVSLREVGRAYDELAP